MITEPSIVLLDWVDACFNSDEAPKPLMQHSVGWLVEADSDATVIAMEQHEGLFRDFLCVPTAYIVGMTFLVRAEDASA